MSVDSSTGQIKPSGQEEAKTALKAVLQTDSLLCVSIARFATTASPVIDFKEIATQTGYHELTAAIDGIVFETDYPHFYTNWEAALSLVLDTQSPLDGNLTVYLVTDGNPTTRTSDCDLTEGQPCRDMASTGIANLSLDLAKTVAATLQSMGVSIVAVGLGGAVTDSALEAVSGPCNTTTGCVKGLNYLHVSSLSQLGEFVQGSTHRPSTTSTTSTTSPTSTTSTTSPSPTTSTTSITSTTSTSSTETTLPRTTPPPSAWELAHPRPVYPEARFLREEGAKDYTANIYEKRIETGAPRNEGLSGGALTAVIIGGFLGLAVLMLLVSIFMYSYVNSPAASNQLNWAMASSNRPVTPFPAPRFPTKGKV